MFTATSFDTTKSSSWEQVKKSILEVPSYKQFLAVTSKQELLVVPNQPDFSTQNKKGNCHENCHLLQLEGKGLAVSGWYLMCDLIFNEVPAGVCRLLHHCNLQLTDGSVINPSIDFANLAFHIFLKDDARRYDLDREIGYNDRMIFGDHFEGDDHAPRNKVFFASKDQLSRDVFYEKFKVYKTLGELSAAIPRNLSDKERDLWMALKVGPIT